MRKLLLFFAMLCVSVGMWAYSSQTQTFDDGSTFAASDEGSDTQVFTVTAGGIAAWYAAADDAQKSAMADNASRVKLKITGTLSNADLQALGEACFNKFTSIDMSGATLASGASISNIRAGNAIETVILPNGLSKAEVNAAGAALTSCNANFGSCISIGTEISTSTITNYYYAEGANNGQMVVEGNTVILDKNALTATVTENVQVDLTLEAGYPKSTYINTLNNNDVVEVAESDIETYEEWGQTKYRTKPNPLTVGLTMKLLDSNNNDRTSQAQQDDNGYYVTEWSNNAKIIVYTQEGKEGYYNDPECTDRNWSANNVQQDELGNYYYIGGANVKVYLTESWVYRYNNNDVVYSGEKIPNGDGTYTGSIENNDIYFEVSTTYKYTYELDGETKEYTTNQEDTDLKYDTTHDVVYTVEAREEEESTSATNVTAYVNKPGTLYKATNLGEVAGIALNKITISGNITLGDIANTKTGADPGQTGMVTSKYTDTVAEPAQGAWFNNNSGNAKELDLGDAKIDNSEFLRNVGLYSNLETIIFPKQCESIPDACCYSNGNSGVPHLKNVTFPENVKSIGKYAFHDTALEALVLPGTIQSVGDYAFYTCKQLENVEMESLEGTCTFGEYVFASSTVKHVTLSEGVDAIGAHMFDFCASLESVRIPTTAKTIKTGAFAACASLHKLVIPEGVELLEQNVFNGAGLTDIYVMATSAAKVPKIYCLGTNPFDNSIVGTFTVKNILGNNTAPNKEKGTDYDETTSMETALSWYQEEFSDMNIGIGGNNCMIQLHYPENMASFYNGTENLPEGWLDNLNSIADRELAEWEVAKAEQSGWLSTVYAYGSYEYDEENGTHKGGSSKRIGPTEGGLYWPNQQDYYIRLAAGYSSSGEPTAEAWRQIPLQGITDAEEIIYTKKYDDTWYTMAFPWDMDDNTLFSTFNQKCEIVEFMGAEVLPGENENEYNLIFHFDEVAKTRYMPEDHSAEYRRIDSEHTRSVVISANGQQTIKKYYTYEDINTGDLVYWPYHTGNDATAAEREMQKKYNAIMHMMVFAGHPYMIHPSIGAKAGQPKDCTIAGVKKVKLGEGIYERFATLADVAEDQKVEKVVSANEYGSTTKPEWTNPVTGAGGKYAFKGNINDAVETDGVSDNGVQDMPTENGPVYFLGLKPGTDYPQYFRKAKGKGKGKWTQYSAIIIPDDDAIANVEGLDGMSVGSGSGSGAKGFDVAFGEWEVVDAEQMATVIDNAVVEGKEKNEPAKIQHLNVVYNIKGQVVRSNSTSVEGLPKGLYIVNGKKYMVK